MASSTSITGGRHSVVESFRPFRLPEASLHAFIAQVRAEVRAAKAVDADETRPLTESCASRIRAREGGAAADTSVAAQASRDGDSHQP